MVAMSLLFLLISYCWEVHRCIAIAFYRCDQDEFIIMNFYDSLSHVLWKLSQNRKTIFSISSMPWLIWKLSYNWDWIYIYCWNTEKKLSDLLQVDNTYFSSWSGATGWATSIIAPSPTHIYNLSDSIDGLEKSCPLSVCNDFSPSNKNCNQFESLGFASCW